MFNKNEKFVMVASTNEEILTGMLDKELYFQSARKGLPALFTMEPLPEDIFAVASTFGPSLISDDGRDFHATVFNTSEIVDVTCTEDYLTIQTRRSKYGFKKVA